jgi:hypothetical protein
MTKSELWRIFTDRNPLLESDTAYMTTKKVKQFFELTWNSAYTAGRIESQRREKTQAEIMAEALGINPYR